MPHDIFGFWGKTRTSDLGKLERHPLAFHMLDVAACAERLLAAWPERFDQIASRFDMNRAELGATAIRLIALHDIGKCARGFQAKVLDLWPSALGPRPKENSVASVRHDAAGLWLFTNGKSALRTVARDLLPGLDAGARLKLLQAVCGHHGEPANVGDIGERDTQIGKAAENAALVLAQAMLSVLPASAPPNIPETAIAPLSFALAGVTILSDWLGSNTLWFDYREPSPQPATVASELAYYWENVARPKAEHALAKAGLSLAESAPFMGLRGLFPGISWLTPLQSLAETLVLSENSPTLVVIEDMTGAGKTEAAVTLAHRLIASGRSRGVYVALPTMATANAMFGRLAKSYLRMFREGERPSIALVHGKRNLVEGFASLPRELGADEAEDREDGANDDPSQVSASAFCADWIARSNKQAFLAQVGAGTIDQALLSILPARHQALRLWGLADKVLVIDEAHAYDAYMGKEIETLLRFHAELGGSAIVLSATLPRGKRTALINAFRQGLGGAPTRFVSKTSAYPLVTSVSAAAIEEIPSSLREGLSRTVRITRAGDVETAHAAVLDAARRGAAVALIRNTVDEAIASHAALASAFDGEKPLLFHARFAMGDRLAIEDSVLGKFGRETASDTKRPGILVATQVVEQSLDLDFDFLVTDLAPVDLLIQRAGRLWRHMDLRPAPERPAPAPELLVISAEPTPESGPNWLDAVLPETKFVYEDAALLWRSAKALFGAGSIVSRTRAEGERDSPGEIRALIEAAYGDEKTAIPDALAEAENKAMGNASGERSQAGFNVLDFEKGYDLDGGRWESDARISTRLGDETITLRLAVIADGRLRPWAGRDAATGDERRAWALSEVSVRATRCSGVPKPSGKTAALSEAARGDWTVSEREIPVLILAPDPESRELWRGAAMDKEGREIAVAYSQCCGLMVAK